MVDVENEKTVKVAASCGLAARKRVDAYRGDHVCRWQLSGCFDCFVRFTLQAGKVLRVSIVSQRSQQVVENRDNLLESHHRLHGAKNANRPTPQLCSHLREMMIA